MVWTRGKPAIAQAGVLQPRMWHCRRRACERGTAVASEIRGVREGAQLGGEYGTAPGALDCKSNHLAILCTAREQKPPKIMYTSINMYTAVVTVSF